MTTSLKNIYFFYIVVLGVPFTLLIVTFNLYSQSQYRAEIFVFFLAMYTSFYYPLMAFERRKQLQRRKFTLLRSKLDQELKAARFEIQEQVVKYVSAEIHDHLKASIALAKFNLSCLVKDYGEENEKKILNAVDLLSTVYEDLGRISRSLNIDQINSDGLIAVLEREIDRVKSTGKLEVETDFKGKMIFLDDDKEFLIFRIIQEAIGNIIKHAEAKKITLMLSYLPEKLELMIKDDGKGFIYPIKRNQSSGAGLENMKGRVEAMGGRFLIRTEPGKGASIHALIPFSKQEILNYQTWEDVPEELHDQV
jgi:two-component system, NarL family, sensor kinase